MKPLLQRLYEAEQSIDELKDILDNKFKTSVNDKDFDIIVSNTGKIVALPKDSVYKINHDKLLVNYMGFDGKFVISLDDSGLNPNWVNTNMICEISDGEQKLTPIGVDNQIRYDVVDSVNNTDVWYFGAWFYNNEEAVDLATAVVHDGGTDWNIKTAINKTTSWEWHSLIIDLSLYTNGRLLAFYIKNKSFTDGGQLIKIKNAHFFNLSEAYTTQDKDSMDIIMENTDEYLYRGILEDSITINTATDVDKLLRDYTLYWEDQFEGSALDPSRWNHRYLGIRNSAINIEDAIEVSDGSLKIKTYQNNGEAYTGMISTDNLFETKYGYFEMRAKLPKNNVCWPAFWLQSDTIGNIIGDTRNSGTEIDIMEDFTSGYGRIQHALHWDGYDVNHQTENFKQLYPDIVDFNDEYHTFGAMWDTNGYKFYIDGYLTYETTSAPSDVAEYIILSCEVDENRKKTLLSDNTLTDKFEIDYVKVYKKNG